MASETKVEVWFDGPARRQEVLVNGELVGDANFREHGWEGMRVQANLAEQMARVLGHGFEYHDFNEKREAR